MKTNDRGHVTLETRGEYLALKAKGYETRSFGECAAILVWERWDREYRRAQGAEFPDDDVCDALQR